MRLRRSDERRRYSAPQRAAKVDANPHQINAVIFALGRLREGGCILADEVGLGKTIEAGLVIAQLIAEGARRVLLITPKPLLGQWRQELYQLFNIDAVEAEPRIGGFDGEGVFLIGREAAGSVKGRDAILLSDAFDLCVIDEAHEVFAGIYKRFDKFGEYKEDAPEAQTAGRLRELLMASRTPVLLLTATPMQNNLVELWGLVQYVDPLGTLLGDLTTFREVFCGVDDRHLAEGQEEDLRNRLRVVLQRTLRREAQDFLEKPFVRREARLFEYTMSPAEKLLYDDVTRYLLEPGILAFQGRQRQLLLLGFHRRMASSTRALASSLERVATRLQRMLGGTETPQTDDQDSQSLLADLEDDGGKSPDAQSTPDDDGNATRNTEAVSAELKRVEDFIERAEKLGADDSKFRALLRSLRFVTERSGGSHGAGKLVIFTESRATQSYLRDRLVESRLITEDEITLFSGTNDSPRAQQALARWIGEVPQGEGVKVNRDIATRLALVHEFKTRTRVFISTEAGAKGLNLQFCDTVVNYDLPWNPQRIEQRIGRCHRYGQQHDVTVINFLAKDNLAQALTFDILSQKLELFGTVLDASDQILHRASGNLSGEVLVSVLGTDFESELRRIYDRARTLDEVTAELEALRDKVTEERKRFEEAHSRTASLIETRFEEGLQRVFRGHKEGTLGALAELDRDLESVVTSYLDAVAIPYSRETVAGEDLLHVSASPLLPPELAGGITAALGPSKEHASLHLSHPLVLAAVADARNSAERIPALIRPPEWVHVVDREDFEYTFSNGAVLYAVPCMSSAGQRDPTESIPTRTTGDERIRIGMVHGSTFDAKDWQTNFPINSDAVLLRGLDYLAIGDTHGFRFIPPNREYPPTIYPGAPEATAFDEKDPGSVAVVFINRQRVATVRQERVARWTWEERNITTLEDLRALVRRSDLDDRVLRLRVNMKVSAPDYDEAEILLEDLQGTSARHAKVGVLELDRQGLELETATVDQYCEELPEVLKSAVTRLKVAAEDPAQRLVAERALFHLYRSSKRKAS